MGKRDINFYVEIYINTLCFFSNVLMYLSFTVLYFTNLWAFKKSNINMFQHDSVQNLMDRLQILPDPHFYSSSHLGSSFSATVSIPTMGNPGETNKRLPQLDLGASIWGSLKCTEVKCATLGNETTATSWELAVLYTLH